MRLSKTFVTALTAVGFVAIAGSASACDWYKQQVQAKAAPPAAEEQADVAVTPIDPVILARIESREATEAADQK